MFASLRKLLNYSSHTRPRASRSRVAQLGLETLSDRVLMSVAPLVFTTAATAATNHTVILTVAQNAVEIFDNGKLAAAQAISSTSSITLNGGTGTKNGFEVLNTPANIATTINLASTSDAVFVGDVSSPNNPFGLPTPGLLGGGTTTPSVPGVQGIQGNLTIVGRPLGLNAVTVDDSSDTVRCAAALRGNAEGADRAA